MPRMPQVSTREPVRFLKSQGFVYQIKITLLDVKPRIWRHIEN